MQGEKSVTSKTVQQKQRFSSSYCSDNESNCSQGNRGEEANVAGSGTVKARAGRGSAADPQSLYAKVSSMHVQPRRSIQYDRFSGCIQGLVQSFVLSNAEKKGEDQRQTPSPPEAGTQRNQSNSRVHAFVKEIQLEIALVTKLLPASMSDCREIS